VRGGGDGVLKVAGTLEQPLLYQRLSEYQLFIFLTSILKRRTFAFWETCRMIREERESSRMFWKAWEGCRMVWEERKGSRLV
jgi:hypothetical protein